ncbi:MAG: glutamate racemase [bacterium]|nr:glutamate racemase [bacterium]MDT8396084.1 glutamate racemase [bacterium]
MIKLGIFDSGIGGLTVYREVRRALPGADIRYFGDTARVPYGTKSARTVTQYSLQIARYLAGQEVDAVIVACNTASAYAMDVLKDTLEIPCFGVVVPGAKAAVDATRSRVVGVLGTRGTISSGAYQKAIADLDPAVSVIATPCPLFVPLVEEGWFTDPITQDVAIRYLEPHLDADVDTLVLGCTHYPMLKRVISMVMGNGITLIDSGQETAQAVKSHLEEKGFTDDSAPGQDLFEVTDSPGRFADVGRLFLEREITGVTQVTIVEGEED